MEEFEPFDVPDGTEKFIFLVARCETPQLTILLEIYCTFLAKSLAFHQESYKTKFRGNVMNLT